MYQVAYTPRRRPVCHAPKARGQQTCHEIVMQWGLKKLIWGIWKQYAYILGNKDSSF